MGRTLQDVAHEEADEIRRDVCTDKEVLARGGGARVESGQLQDGGERRPKE